MRVWRQGSVAKARTAGRRTGVGKMMKMKSSRWMELEVDVFVVLSRR